ncbi:hypothetical protein MPNT_10209 [Candidatus Methylacidithermus pantelleriae]|uniref:Uncharacterized protein n=1 Tax=Candidatus Methylacidithermus pantelleriae TaxID=2744239 RepID=A0A8J2FRA4_9BACT|nr:hypothetical protein MPNT_10209 [Candidatus Methylacidithermus pantelleriae]
MTLCLSFHTGRSNLVSPRSDGPPKPNLKELLFSYRNCSLPIKARSNDLPPALSKTEKLSGQRYPQTRMVFSGVSLEPLLGPHTTLPLLGRMVSDAGLEQG